MGDSPLTNPRKGIYVHIPFCRQKCTYCDFPSYQGLEDYFDVYAYALREEIKGGRQLVSEAASFDTIYLGGGTPTMLSLKELERILDTLHKTYRIAPSCEITIEANPGEVDAAYLKGLRTLGFNRISFGVQTFHDEHLQSLRRTHTAKEAIASIEDAHRAGFQNISIDQIYGLPTQTLDDIDYNLQIIATLPISHISMYGLQVEEGTYLYRQVQLEEVKIPDDTLLEQMYDKLIDGLVEQNFDRYEIASFCKDDQYSHHNVKYWHGSDYLGFGAGAHSFVNGIRYENTPYVVPYIHALEMGESPRISTEAILSPRDYEDFAFLALRTRWGLSESIFYDRFHKHLKDIYGEVFSKLETQGLLTYRDGAYCLTRDGAKHGNYVFSQCITT